MTQFLPPNLLALFAPRDPVPYLPPVEKLPHEKKTHGYSGIAAFLNEFEDPKDTPPPTRVETREERLERRRRERAEQVAYKLEQEIALWDPNSFPNATMDPFKTLFIARVNYDTSESKLRREFEVYGPIKKIVMVHNKVTGKPRGYAFIEYEHERDMHSAYKHADGKKIDGRRVLVDVERSRTVKGWLPRRGGLGGTRRGGPDVNLKHSGREDNERERERYRLERERELAGGPPRARSGSNDRERERERRRSRSRERKRRTSRSRSRDRRRRRSRERIRDDDIEEVEFRPKDRSDRDRDRDRKRRRERENSEDRNERKRDRKERRKERERNNEEREEKVFIKQEPVDDYQEYDNYEDEAAVYDEALVKHEKEEQNGGARAYTADDY
ncbi:hypothetical protein M8J75_000670 [Diaphorina citri]|nr:hypothetical protein M8J75_000670 [Diaphorina citri]